MNPELIPLPPVGTSPFPARILVLDDERVIANVLGELLTLHGYCPTVCFSPKRALELIEMTDYDLILSDYRMPFMNGKEFFLAATRLKPELARRIIFLTGDVMHEESQTFLELAGAPHLSKPVRFAALEKVVAGVLRKSLLQEPPHINHDDCVALCA
ncbi:MAG: response regulator [Limisphaerales bacterium]